MGTLLELGNCTLDVLRDLVGRPAGQAIAPATGSSEPHESPLDVKEGVITARHNLETILIYAATQLAMWLSKPEPDTTTEMDTDDQAQDIHHHHHKEAVKERKTTRPSSTLVDRLRRGMTGEMASDLQSLLNKAKPIILKSKNVLGTTDDVDLTQVLSNFLHERVGTAG
jgi:nuclear pore complex protein Nup188